MTFLFSNNAQTTLAESLTSTGTTLTVASGGGALFPTPSTGKIFAVTITSATNPDEVEICYCTGIATDTMTISRGKDNTTAQSFSAGDLVSLFPTAGVTSLFAQAGYLGVFSSTVAADIGGYELNAIVADGTVSGLYWRSTAALNTTTPGVSGASWDAFILDQSLIEWTQIGTSQYLTVPSWAKYIEVIQIGGGGGGAGCQGSSTSQSISGAGGGGGGVLRTRHLLTSGATVAQYIGAGGSGANGASTGHNGGDTYLVIGGSTVATAGGGSGGDAYAQGGSAGGGGGTNTLVSGGLIGSYEGSDGGDGQVGTWMFPGNGAPGYLGAGAGRAGSGGGQPASSPGAGGGGAYDGSLSGAAYSGGTGAAGACLYRWIP